VKDLLPEWYPNAMLVHLADLLSDRWLVTCRARDQFSSSNSLASADSPILHVHLEKGHHQVFTLLPFDSPFPPATDFAERDP
jgi:hypothetical protein